jgi:hypothetical protein
MVCACGRIGFDGSGTGDGGFDARDSDSGDSDGPLAAMAPAFVQITASADPSSPGTLSVTLNNVVVGNVLVVETDADPEMTAITSVTDSVGNTYASIPSFPSTDLTIRALLTYAVVTTGGQVTITATIGASGVSQEIRVAEYSHVNTSDPSDAIAWGAGPNATAMDGARTDDFVTDAPNDLIFSVLLLEGIDGAAGSGFVQRSGFNFDVIQDRIEPTPGTHAAIATAPGSAWVIGALALHGEPE